MVKKFEYLSNQTQTFYAAKTIPLHLTKSYNVDIDLL